MPIFLLPCRTPALPPLQRPGRKFFRDFRKSIHPDFCPFPPLFLAEPDLDLFRVLAAQRAAEFIARKARSLWGYAGWAGDREAIEPAGGVSPLRGGADVCDHGLSTEGAEQL